MKWPDQTRMDQTESESESASESETKSDAQRAESKRQILIGRRSSFFFFLAPVQALPEMKSGTGQLFRHLLRLSPGLSEGSIVFLSRLKLLAQLQRLICFASASPFAITQVVNSTFC